MGGRISIKLSGSKITAKRKYKRICDVLWVVTSLTICVASIRLKLGNLLEPGPGFMPFVAGLFLLLFSLPTFFEKSDEGGKEEIAWSGPYWKRAITTIISLSTYALLLNRLGYLLTTFLLMAFLFWAPENKRWTVTIFKAVLSTGLTYIVFDKWLDCQLPRGIFGF